MRSISVVIALFNKEPCIGLALKSVLTQTIMPDEIIVVDDGSPDGEVDVAKSFADHRVLVFSQGIQGVSVTRNKGISEAKGN